jgi:hypothetical protein
VVKQQQQREQRERFLVNKQFVRLKRHKHARDEKKEQSGGIPLEKKSLSLFSRSILVHLFACSVHTQSASLVINRVILLSLFNSRR